MPDSVVLENPLSFEDQAKQLSSPIDLLRLHQNETSSLVTRIDEINARYANTTEPDALSELQMDLNGEIATYGQRHRLIRDRTIELYPDGQSMLRAANAIQSDDDRHAFVDQWTRLYLEYKSEHSDDKNTASAESASPRYHLDETLEGLVREVRGNPKKFIHLSIRMGSKPAMTWEFTGDQTGLIDPLMKSLSEGRGVVVTQAIGTITEDA